MTKVKDFGGPEGQCWASADCPNQPVLVYEDTGPYAQKFRFCRDHAIEKVDDAIEGKAVTYGYILRSIRPEERRGFRIPHSCPECGAQHK